MGKQMLAGIDVGTTGVKVILFDMQGTIMGSAYEEYKCMYLKTGWVEQDPDMLIQAVYRTCRAAIRSTAVNVCDIQGVSVSAQRSCAVLMSQAGTPLKMISWLDNRAVDEVKEIEEAFGAERFYEITGLPLCATWILPKLLHVRKDQPELWKKVHKVCQLQDLILRALGVDGYYGNEPEAGFWGLWDNQKLCFHEALLQTFSISPSLLPEIRQVGELVGRITEKTSALTGFAEGMPICVGIGDQNSAAVGAGIVTPGAVSVSLGTGGLATALLQDCYRDPKGQAMVTSHAIHGMWTFEGLQNAAAGVYRWFRDEIAVLEKQNAEQNGGNAYDALNQMISSVPAGAKGLLMLPYFAGSAAPRWDASARGGFIGLTLSHDRACMARSCVEGITLEQKDILRSLPSMGQEFSYVRIVGGATRSEVWNQIQADVYNLPCETLEVSDAAALGAAISAGAGVGAFKSIGQGAREMVHVRRRYEPDPEQAAIYEKLYAVYCNTCEALTGAKVFRDLAQF